MNTRSRGRKRRELLFSLAVMAPLGALAHLVYAADEYWDPNATGGWTSSNWSTSAPPTTYGGGWTSGSNANFTANSSLIFASTTVGNVTVADNTTVTINTSGNLTLGAVRTFNIGNNSTLTWNSQPQVTGPTNEGAGIIKTGLGTLSLGNISRNTRYDGGFTLSDGTVIVSGQNSFGTGPMTINGGILQSSAGSPNAFAVNSLTIGGDFTLAGTGNDVWNVATFLGADTRTITNSTSSASANRSFAGVISGAGGLTFNGTGTGTITLSGANNYAGDTTISSGVLRASNASGSATGTGLVTVQSAGTLAGNGTVGDVSLSAATSALRPGVTQADGSVGTLTMSSLAAAGGDLRFDIPTTAVPTNSSSFDHIAVTDTATFNAATAISIVPGTAVGDFVLLAAHSMTNANTELSLSTTNDGTNSFALDFTTPNEVILDVTPGVVTAPANLTFTGSAGSGNWNINSTTNFTSGSGAVAYHEGDNVTFNDCNSGQYKVTLTAGPGTPINAGSITPGSVMVNTANTYFVGGAGIAGSTSLTKTGAGTLVLSNTNTFTGDTNINQGALTLTVEVLTFANGSIANSSNVNIGVVSPSSVGTLNISGPVNSSVLTQTLKTLNVNNGAVSLAAVPLGTHSARHTVLSVGGLTVASTGKIDLTDNVLVVRNGAGNLSTIVGYLDSGLNSASDGYWDGSTGIVSTTAATGDSSLLTTLGYRQGDGSASFEGTTPGANDVIVAYTYYGDADLDGQIDGGDYTQMDNGFSFHRTGWSNGDFNYDGVVDGTDFSLIDNTYNQLTAMNKIATQLTLMGSPATQEVPEPTTVSLLTLSTIGLLTRRRYLRNLSNPRFSSSHSR